MEAQSGISAGIGIAVDVDGEVVVLVAVESEEEEQFTVPMTPDVAIAFGRGMREMAREAQILQDELDDLDPEEVHDRLWAIQARFAADRNG